MGKVFISFFRLSIVIQCVLHIVFMTDLHAAKNIQDCPVGLKLLSELDNDPIKSVRAGQKIHIRARGKILPKSLYHWKSYNGVLTGVGHKVIYSANPTFMGIDTIELQIKLKNTVCPAITYPIKVTRILPKIEIEKVIKKNFKDKKSVTFIGKVLHAHKFDQFRVEAYSHTDIFYRHPDHPLDIDKKSGRFKVRFELKKLTDRLVLMLVDKSLKPFDKNNCALRGIPGRCAGFHDLIRHGKNRMPLKLDDKKVFDSYVYYVRPERKHENPQIEFILNNFTPWEVRKDYGSEVLANSGIIRSHMEHGQTYLYDISLAIMALTHAGLKTEARKLLRTLEGIQINEGSKRDGSWYFSFRPNGTSIYPEQLGDRRVAGSIAWAVMAINAYRLKFKDGTFDKMNKLALDYLVSEIQSITYKGKKLEVLRFNQEDLDHTLWPENKVTSVEHNIDFFSALSHYRGPNQPFFRAKALAIRKHLESMWYKDHFHPGLQLFSKPIKPNLNELYLDTQSWAALAMAKKGYNKINWAKALQFNCKNFFETAGFTHEDKNKYFIGFFDMSVRGVNRKFSPKHRFVWTEGTLGMIMAMREVEKKYKKPVKCFYRGENYTADQMLKNLKGIVDKTGGVRYATFTKSTEFGYRGGSLVGSAWLYFAEKGFNPFQPKF